MDKLHEVAKYLLENETMEAEEFYALFGEKAPDSVKESEARVESTVSEEVPSEKAEEPGNE